MLSFLFFILAVLAGAAGFMLLPAGMAQMGAYAVALLFLVLFLMGMVRQSNRPWR